jgi:hypothetical protein
MERFLDLSSFQFLQSLILSPDHHCELAIKSRNDLSQRVCIAIESIKRIEELADVDRQTAAGSTQLEKWCAVLVDQFGKLFVSLLT